MTPGALWRRMAFLVALVVVTTLKFVWPSTDTTALIQAGSVHVYANDLLVATAFALGSLELLRNAGDDRPSLSRFACRLILAYLLYQLLVVVPVAMWLGDASLRNILRGTSLKFDWLYLPALLPLFKDARMRSIAAKVLVAAAVFVAVMGVYLAATGQGGYYLENGIQRYRILTAIAVPVFFWPMALAVAGDLSGLSSLALFALAMAGQAFTSFRSGIITIMGAAFAGLVASRRVGRVVGLVVPVALLGAIAFLLFSQQIMTTYGYVLSKLVDLSSTNATDRLMRWRLAADFLLAHPINDYTWTWRIYQVALQEGYQPHNFVLEIGQNEGFIGLAFYAAMLGVTLRGALDWIWTDREVRVVTVFLLACLAFASFNATMYASGADLPLLVGAVGALVVRIDALRRGEAPADAPAEGSSRPLSSRN